MKIVTFNVRCQWDKDGINSFIHRIGLIYDKIGLENPDVIAFQEMTAKHLDVLKKLLPEYEFFGSGRLADYSSEGLYTAYKKERYLSVKNRIFWISDTPEVPESKFACQSIFPRICIETKLFDKNSKKCVNVYNVHLDHRGLEAGEKEDARTKGLECVFNQTTGDCPAVVLGDFNAKPEHYSLSLCNKYGFIDVTDNLTVTFHNYGNPEKFMKIDYILVSKELKDKVSPAYIWDDMKNGIYLSDHYPVACEIDL